MEYKIKNISKQALSLETGDIFLQNQSFQGPKTPRLETYELRGYISCIPVSSLDKQTPEKNITQETEGDSASVGVSRITAEEVEASPAIPTPTTPLPAVSPADGEQLSDTKDKTSSDSKNKGAK